jgi:signal peptidase I
VLYTRGPTVSRTAAEQRAHLMREIVETLLFVGIVFVVIHFTVQSNQVQDASMSPALQQDQLIAVNKAAYVLGGPSRGDVVVFIDPIDLKTERVGRIIAVPGDIVTITASQVIVNGVTLKERYISVPPGLEANPTIVPALKLHSNQYWVMPDARTQAGHDSRSFGPIARGNVVGKAVVVFWPLKDFHSVSNYSDVFSGVGR